jgi:Rrf2 family protein
MRFTSQEEYGLRCLLQLARAGGRLTIAAIAEREGLTSAYVAKLLSVLQGAGLVASTRGRAGGYRLSREPQDVDLATVMAALDGRLYTADFCGRHAGTEPTGVAADAMRCEALCSEPMRSRSVVRASVCCTAPSTARHRLRMVQFVSCTQVGSVPA